MPHRPSLSLCWLLLAAACVPELRDDELALVSEPRLLALRAEPPEAAVAQQVTLTALVAAAEPAGFDPARIGWQLCLDRKPLSELGPVSPECLGLDAVEAVARPLGQGASVAATVPADACRLFGPELPPPRPGEPSGRPVDPDPTGGFYQPLLAFLDDTPNLGAVRLDCALGGAGRDAAIDFRQRFVPNRNPELDRLTLAPEDGDELELNEATPASVPPGGRATLRAQWAACPRSAECGDGLCTSGEDASACPGDCSAGARGCSGAETYPWFDPESRQVLDRRESVVVTWFATAGTFSERRTGVSETDPDDPHTETVWTSPQQPGEVRLWSVLRDDRGGVGWREVRVLVE